MKLHHSLLVLIGMFFLFIFLSPVHATCVIEPCSDVKRTVVEIYWDICHDTNVCSPKQGMSCNVQNACGATAEGLIQCDGSCSAEVPSLPGNYGEMCLSGENSCGAQMIGMIMCDSTCSATSPPFVPSNLGETCYDGYYDEDWNWIQLEGTIDCYGNCAIDGNTEICSAENSCGMKAYAFKQSGEECPAVPPSEALCLVPDPLSVLNVRATLDTDTVDPVSVQISSIGSIDCSGITDYSCESFGGVSVSLNAPATYDGGQFLR